MGELTLLQITQYACNELGLNAPSVVMASQDLQVIQFRSLLNRDGIELYQDRDWTFLQGEHIVNLATPISITGDVTAGSTSITNVSSIAGISPATAFMLSGVGVPTAQRLVSAAATTIVCEMENTVSGTAVALTVMQDTYELPSNFDRYISNTWWDRTNHWMLIGPQSPQFDQWQRSGIVTTGPRRRWRQIGIQPQVFRLWPPPTTSDTPAALVFEYVNDGWVQHVDGSFGKRFTADTDIPLLDDDAMILGAKWRFLQAKGISYGAQQQEYLDYVKRLKARDGGMPDLALNRRRFPYLISSANVQDGNFPG